MKIDRNKLKKSTTEVPADCKSLIEKLKNVAEERLLDELKAVKSWTFGKCELYHWSDILDRFDEVLDKACKKESDRKWMLSCDIPDNGNLKDLLLQVLQFTSLLIEHSFSRHLYNSMEHLTTLLSSCDMTIVLAVLNLLYVFSKRSNFITRLGNDKKQGLIIRLTHLAESWGGKDNGFGLAECCKDSPVASFPSSATTLHFEFYTENKEEKGSKKANVITSIHMEHLDKSEKLPSEIMEELMDAFKIPEEKQTLLYTHIRLAYLFSKYEARVQCVHARLQALAILVYSNAIQENMNVLLYPGLIEELVDIVELKDDSLVEIKSASLRTLTSIIHLERNPKLNNIIDATGASSYHGFLPVLVRSCIQHMTDPHLKPFPQQYATALFSFLYHLASYENGVEALVSCGMMECLLKVINWYGDGQEHITQFVTRAVRVVDLITNLDMAAFQSQGGLSTFINRLEHEVEICRKEQPFEIHVRSNRDSIIETSIQSPQPFMETDLADKPGGSEMNNSEETSSHTKPNTSAADEGTSVDGPVFDGPSVYEPQVSPKTGVQCFAQRAALLKSMLNFLKKAIPDPAFSESIRHLMEGSLPKSLRHIISNAEYYGPSLFLLATDVVTVYVFQEPSLLSSLQDSGLTDVVLHALLIKDVPATREVLASLPNVFSALCLNTRGLESFVSCKPFDRLFKVLLSPDYLPAMRRRRSSDSFGDTASNLGNAMDELMRHQPSLRTDATKAIIKLLEEVSSMGLDPHYVCQKPQPKVELNALSAQSPQPPDNGSSDEEDEDEDIPNTQDSSLTPKPSQSAESTEIKASSSQSTAEKQAIPLLDYVLNVMKFVEAILSNNSTDDHCREFVAQKGLQPLMGILGLPNLPIDFPTSPACQAVSIVCKAILTLSREPQVLKQGLLKLEDVLQNLESLHKPLESPGGSVLLRELANASHLSDPTASPQSTPLLHALSSCHAYIMMFVHVCRMGQTDIRTISVSHWGSDLGLKVLEGLSKLYTSLVWESTVLLALCSEDILPKGSDFGKVDMDKLLPKDFKAESESKEDEPSSGSLIRSTGEMGSNGVSAAMESLSTSEHHDTPMDVSESQNTAPEPSSSQSSTEKDKDKDGKKSKISPTLQAQVKQLKPLLSVSSRLCRSLAELFGLLVKLCVGSPVRQRRSHQITPNPTTPSPAAQAVAKALTRLLTNGLQWEPPPYSPVPKLRLTFLVCSVGFTSPMLFDEKKHPYHLMLQKFQTSGGQAALFQAFSWALSINGKLPMTDGLESPELPDGTGEFLDAWLMLVEKMVNPKTVLESAHTLPTKSTQPGFVPFSPTQYLISTQKAAFNAVMNLWNKKPLKVYGSRMSESILAILCHIIKGENIIAEQLAKEREELGEASASGTGPVAGSSASSAPPPAPQRPSEPEINQSHLQQLMDMGFTREHCIQALTHTSNLEQATEYILTHPLVPQIQPGLVMDMDLSEEDQMMRAIAMSLGENVVMSTDAAGQPRSQEKSLENEEKKPSQEKTEGMDEKQKKEEPLDKSVIDKFTDCVLPGCLTLLDTLPETVYRVCDLLIVVTQRNGSEWQKKILSSLVEEIQKLGHQMLSVDQLVENTPSDSSTDKKTHPVASKFATRLHLFSLLFEEAMMPCAETIEDVYLTDLLVQVLNSGQEFLTTNKDSVTHKWLAPLLLLLDLYEKVSVISKRKAEANKLLENSHTWKWFDDSSGRWCKYSLGNNKTIDDAYQAGETSVRFQAGRRRYTVYFSSMVQLNEETGNRRPIMLTLPTPEENQQIKEEPKQDNKVITLSAETNQDSENKMETTESEDKKTKETRIVKGLNPDQITSIIRSVVTLISIPVEPESLHAAMRLALRLTREHKYALLFAELNGPKLLLELTQSSAFQGFLSLATLIFRHILEEPSSLRYCMERVVKKATSGSGSSMSGVHQGSLGSKEVHYVLRVLGPAACRDPSLFAEVTKNVLRIALPPPSKRDEDESRYTSPNAPQILKSLSTKQLAITSVESPIKEVLHDLLNGLIFKINYKDDGSETRTAQTLAEAISEVVNELNDRQSQLRRQNSAADFAQEDETAEGGPDQANKDSKDKDGKSAEELRKQRPLIPKSSILRLLSEMVKSYSSCTQLITQYTYQSGQTELVSEECTVLAFVLDHLLPQCQKDGDRDCPALSRVFLASIASCNHCPEAQLSLVNEIKGALQRALALPESSDKHTRIQALTNIISIIIESCPSPGQVPNQVFKGQQNVMNNIVKSLLKKGLVSDLARIPHSLDLSSPYMASTINSALKPLETLSRSVNQPIQSVTAKPKSKTDTDNADTIDEGGTTFVPLIPEEDASEVIPSATSHQVEEITIEDISDQVDHQDAYEESQAQIDRASGLEEVLDQLLDTGSGDPESQVLGEMVMDTDTTGRVTHNDDSQDEDLIDVEEDQVDLDHHDSQMMSQDISIDIDDGDVNTHDVHGTESSDTSSDADEDDDNDDGENDDEDDDGDDEEDEDDEGSDMEAENEDFYHDFEPTSMNHHQYYDDNIFQMENMFPLGDQHILFNALDNSQHVRSYGFQLPGSLHDNDNGNEASVPSVPPAPSNVTATHPLLMRQPDARGMVGVARVHRAGGSRQRSTCRYNPSTQTLHVNFPPNPPNPPVILQRLLGPTTAADVLQLTSTLTSVAGPTHTRVVLGNDDLRIISRPDDDLFDELFQDSYPESYSSGSGVLKYIPSTLTRWTEEAKVLDGDSVHDCVTALKPDIIEELEKFRDEELAERRDKRKKASDEKEMTEDKNVAANNEAPKLGCSTTAETLSLNNAMTTTTTTPALTTSVTTSVTTTSSQESSARQISASEAARAAELIATAMVEGILSTPQTSGTSSSSERSAVSDNILAAGGQPHIAETFMTPAQTHPIITPSAPRVERPRSSTPSNISNLASLLLSEDDSATVGRGTPLMSFRQPLDPLPTLPVGSIESPVSTQQPTEGSITPEEVSGISSSDAVTVQSSGSSEELNTVGIAHESRPDSTRSLINTITGTTPVSMGTDRVISGITGIDSTVDFSPLLPLMNPNNVPPGGPPLDIPPLINPVPMTMGMPPMDTALTVSQPQFPTGEPLINMAGLGITPPATTMSTGAMVPESAVQPAGNTGDTGSNLPDGVDPSFLAALPDNIRQEVIAEQMRLNRIQQNAREQAQNAQNTGSMEVNPEFLAALPPSIQEEVLAQQRSEQARLQAQTAPAPPNPDEPIDHASFFATMPSSLRQQVLADMDDSMVAVLPADLAAEAQTLRRDLEERHRRLMQERLFAQAGAGSLSAILRHSGFAGTRLGSGRYPPMRVVARGSGNQWAWRSGRLGGQSSTANTSAMKLRGRHLLDHEALTCLLVLLFLDEPKLNTNRLHRVLRNLCYHAPTRIWVLKALLSILSKTGDMKLEDEKLLALTPSIEKSKKKKTPSMTSTQQQQSSSVTLKSDTKSQGSWLSISLEAALGCRANVFQIQKSGKKHTVNSSPGTVTVHPQAAPMVCRHVLDTLIALAKVFPSQFLPATKAKEVTKCETITDNNKKEEDKVKSGLTTGASSKVQKSSSLEGKVEGKSETDFWDLLVKLDSVCGKKGKGFQRTHSSTNVDNEVNFSNFDTSPLGQLMLMLSHPVVKRSQLLTDRLLRLLQLVSIGLPDVTQGSRTTTASTTGSSVITPAVTTTAVTTNSVTTITSAATSTPVVSLAEGATETTTSPTSVTTANATTPAASNDQETKKDREAQSSSEEEKKVEDKDEPILEDQLQLAVQVLTSKSCSEEGLEDATNLLVQLSWANNATRSSILKLLLEGARELGLTVCSHIRSLLQELQMVKGKALEDVDEEMKDSDSLSANPTKGLLTDRFAPNHSIVVAAPKKIKGGRELQLPSMTLLTSKTSSQQFFLRILKVIIQLRDAARTAVKKTSSRRPDSRDISNIEEAMAAIEAEAESLMEMVGRNAQQAQQLHQHVQSLSQAYQNTPSTTNARTPAITGSGEQNNSGAAGSEPADESSQQNDSNAQSSRVVTQSTASSIETSGGSESVDQRNSLSDSARESGAETPMDIDQPGSSRSEQKSDEANSPALPRLSEQLCLEDLWQMLGECLTELAKTPDHHAVLILQPAVEAFFLVHAGEKEGKSHELPSQKREDQLAHLNIDVAPSSPAPSSSDTPSLVREISVASVSSISNLPPDTQKFLKFAEMHRTVLNQILRQTTTHLADGPFSILVDHTRILDFDVKRRYFRQELERLDEGMRREDLAVHVRRENVFEDSYRELFRRSADEWKHRFYIVFEGEEGQDAGGLLREWYIIISREIFNPMYALFEMSAGDRVTYTINPSSHCNSNHLSYFKFVGRIIAKAIYDNKLLECYFTRSFYKHILGQLVKYTDMESEDYSFYQGLVFLLENNVEDLGYELTFSTEIREFGVTEVRDLKPNGRNIPVTEETKKEYVKLVCQMKMTGAIRQQLNAFMDGFYDIIPKKLIAIFNEQELELLISGLPNIDIDDLKANSEYHKYQPTSLQVQWFWRALRSFDQEERAKFLQFVTGTSKVPLQGFAYLEGMNGYQKFQIHRDDRSIDRLPVAHTCFNQLDLPAYETYDKLRHMLLLACNECSEGFGLA